MGLLTIHICFLVLSIQNLWYTFIRVTNDFIVEFYISLYIWTESFSDIFFTNIYSQNLEYFIIFFHYLDNIFYNEGK